MALALLFLPLVFTASPLLQSIGGYGVFINAFLGAFNLIPFFGLDGEKVLHWNKGWYFGSLIIAGALVAMAFMVVGGA
jgi:Zn-dependent protease